MPQGGDLAAEVDLHELLARARELGASDLHLVTGRPPIVRIHGLLEPLGRAPRLSARAVRRVLFKIGRAHV